MKRIKLSECAMGMLTARYRAVLKRMFCINNGLVFSFGARRTAVGLAAAIIFSFSAGTALANNYEVGTGKSYHSLADLQQAGITFADGDTITIYNDDASLASPLNFGNANVTLQSYGGQLVTVSPQSGAMDSQFLNQWGNTLTVVSNLSVDAFTSRGSHGAIVGDGIIIKGNSNTFRNNEAGSFGGAIYGSELVKIEQGNNEFTNNNAGLGGGAIASDSVVIKDSSTIFYNNEVESPLGMGGAIYGRELVKIEQGANLFINNKAGWGGGAISSDRLVQIEQGTNEFTNNKAGIWGGGAIYSRGAVKIEQGTNKFIDNKSSSAGGAIYGEDITFRDSNNTFSGNESRSSGGAIYSGEALVFIQGINEFADNKAGGNGGAAVGASIAIQDGSNTFRNNEAKLSGGAIYSGGLVEIEQGINEFTNNKAGSFGGAIRGGSIVIRDGSNTFNGNEIEHYGGAIYSEGLVKIEQGINEFTNNKAGSFGGAIRGGSIVIRDGSNTFNGNETEHYGGAIYSLGAVEIEQGVNEFTNNSAGSLGGAIYSEGLVKLDQGMNNFINNKGGSGGALLGYGIVIRDGSNTFNGNETEHYGGAIYSLGAVEIEQGSNAFINNKANSNGGALFGYSIAISDGNNTFDNNQAGEHGGAVYSYGAVKIERGTNEFVNNKAGGSGGAIFGYGIAIRDGSNAFNLNESVRDGGAVDSHGALEIERGTNEFINNKAGGSGGAISGYSIVIKDGSNAFKHNEAVAGSGGAIDSYGAVEIERGMNEFTDNKADSDGGAISGGNIAITGGNNTFKHNQAVVGSGGAIKSHGVVAIDQGVNTFNDNKADWGGGAILGASIAIKGGNNMFHGNEAGYAGGAFYSHGTVEIEQGRSEFAYNKTGRGDGGAIYGASVVIKGGSNAFHGNESGNSGGALYSHGEMEIKQGENEFANNIAGINGGAIAGDGITISDGRNKFSNNQARDFGGAIYSDGTVKIEQGSNEFTSNVASWTGGAIRGASVAIRAGNNKFTGNEAGDYGGAIYSRGTVELDQGSNEFTYNKTDRGNGGAIAGNNIAMKADNSKFSNNAAGQSGGAIYGNSIAIKDGNTIFHGNKAAYQGGAIHSYGAIEIERGTHEFINNNAGGHGGAIYSQGNVTLIAAGGNITFRDNHHAFFTGIYTPNTIYSPNAVYLDNSSMLSLGAEKGHSILFYDPVQTGRSIFSTSFTTTVDINKGVSHTGTVRFDKYQSAINGSTTVYDGTLALTGGAIYGADNNAGSFTLKGGARLKSDVAGNTVNANSINLEADSTVAVDLSQAKALVLNGDVNIDSNAIFDITGLAAEQRAVTAIASNGTITGNFNKVTVGGVSQSDLLTLDRFFNYITYNLENDKINVDTAGLVWNSTATGSAHGTFRVDTEFTVREALSDNRATNAHSFGWNGKTLTKTGQGTLMLTGSNSYSGGTFIKDGMVAANSQTALGNGPVTIDNGAILASSGNLIISSLTNNSLFTFADMVTTARTLMIGSYQGGGTLGLQAAASENQQWSDLVEFAQTPVDKVNVHFTFMPGSSAAYLPEDGLYFATLADQNGTDNIFQLENKNALAGALELVTKTDDNKNYRLLAGFNPTLAKVYSETSAAVLAQAGAGLHDGMLLSALKAAGHDANSGQTGIFAAMERADRRYNTGSHADIDGNRFILAVAKQQGNVTYGIYGQLFTGDYKTTHQAVLGSNKKQSIHADGSLKEHDLGFFAQYRPDGQQAGTKGLAYEAVVRGGRSKQQIKADNASYGTHFDADRDIFGTSLGASYTGGISGNCRTDYYGHLIYTRLGSEQVSDSIGQHIKFDSANSIRLLTGIRATTNLDKHISLFYGAAVDYEFSGRTGAAIDGQKADTASLKGFSGLIELGFSSRQSDSLTIDGSVTGHVGKKRGLAGNLTMNYKF